MNKQATLKQWKNLYEAAIEIKKLAPWEYLWDTDFISIIMPNDELVTCSIMGRSEGCFAVGVYFGTIALKNLMTLVSNPDIPDEQGLRYQSQDVMLCYFGDREELTKEEWNIVKELGYKFRGKNNWIFFRSFKKGYAPHRPDQDEVIQLTDVLQQLSSVLKDYIANKIDIDFEETNTLVHAYSEELNQWVNFSAPLEDITYPKLTIEDELLITRLKKQKTNNALVEVDVAYIPAIIEDPNYPRPVVPRLGIISDTNGMIINQTMLSPEHDETEEILNLIIDYINDHGRPKCIYVRDDYFRSLFEDLCKRTNIRLIVTSRLDAIDNLISELSSFDDM